MGDIRCQNTLRNNKLPDTPAERGQNKRAAHEHRTAEGSTSTPAGPALGKCQEEERHGEIDDAVESCTNHTSELLAALQSPVLGEIFLEDAVAHRETNGVVSWENWSAKGKRMDTAYPRLAIAITHYQ